MRFRSCLLVPALAGVVVLVAVMMPAAAWLFFKPIRIIAPELNGVTCAGAVCVDDTARLPEAVQLHGEAMANVAAKLMPLNHPPRAVFCSTPACYSAFGGRGAGVAVFDLGVIIAPHAWQIYIVEHELIHMLQAQELGLLGRERTPMWFKEGMAFHVSDPPPGGLPDYAQGWAAQYREWEARVGRENVWQAIRAE